MRADNGANRSSEVVERERLREDDDPKSAQRLNQKARGIDAGPAERAVQVPIWGADGDLEPELEPKEAASRASR